MAQALYDQHPLHDYLKQSGDRLDRVPGAFVDDASDDESEQTPGSEIFVGSSLQSSSLADQLRTLQQWISAVRHLFASPSDDFAERFKYDLISSNLLSTSVTPTLSTHSLPSVFMPEQGLPGGLQGSQQDKSDQDLKPLSKALVIFGLAAFITQHRLTALLALLISASFAKAPGIGSAKQSYIPPMFQALDSLKTAGSVWDAAVNDAITIIEQEENSPYYPMSSSALPSPSSALRVTLHSTLVTTQHQCDNIRPLLAALTSPSELSQLSEMYAPSSPSKPSFTLQSRPPSPSQYKRTSLPENTPAYPLRSPTSLSEKRRTWNGSHFGLASRNARPANVITKKDRRQSELLLSSGAADVPPGTPSTPLTPRSPSLAHVVEEQDEAEDESLPVSNSISLNEISPPRDNFSTAALYLRRKRSGAGLLFRRASRADILGLPNSHSVPALREAGPMLYSRSASRFTSLSSTRYPFSLSSLHLALQGSLASRRYACAHLLALRFSDDSEDETYWENVRSVTSLLTTTLEDAAARLNEALATAEDLKRQDGQPTPEGSTEGSPVTAPNDDLLASPSQNFDRNDRLKSQSHASKPSVLLDLQKSTETRKVDSFAPKPNAVSRFALHVDAISSSLSDARVHLLECVQELRDSQNATNSHVKTPETYEEAVLQSYERLRKELGYALRECERGKAALLDVFEVCRIQSRPQDEDEGVDDDAESSPGHAQFHMLSGSSKDSNDRTDPDPLTPGDGSPIMPTAMLEETSNDKYVDDASQHLLLTASAAHLPPPGLEQVFESESTALTSFNRERSKLSREERIRRMKAKRDSMTGRGLAAHLEEEERRTSSHGGWGPGTEVVAELKDVIWKVSERRRKMASAPPSAATLLPSPIVNNSLDGSNDYDTPLCSL